MKYVFIHGRGDHGEDLSSWRKPLADRLREAGVAPPAIDGPKWVEIRYDDLLNSEEPLGPRSLPTRSEVPFEAIEAFVSRQDTLRALSTSQKRSAIDVIDRLPVGKALKAIALMATRDVRRFASDDRLRRAILDRVLDQLPAGEVVLVAHSLGSVVALEALPFLPPTTTVQVLITLGSPAAVHEVTNDLALAGTSRADFPADRVHFWINLVNPHDPVSLGRGLRKPFKDVVDHAVSGPLDTTLHDARTYLHDQSIAPLLEQTVRTDRAIAQREEMSANNDGTSACLTVLFAHLLSESAKDKKVCERSRRVVKDILLPPLSTAMDRTMSATDSGYVISHWVATGASAEDRRNALLYAALHDPFAPYDPGITADDRTEGLRDLAKWLGLDRDQADEIVSLVRECRKVATNDRKSPWKMALIGGGLVAALAIAAPLAVGAFSVAGAGGAAAMTSGLAGIGVGGMAGGISTIAAVATGAGVLGGAVSGADRISLLQNEQAVISDLTAKAALIRMLCRLDEAEAHEAARAAMSLMSEDEADVTQELEAFRSYSENGSAGLQAIERNLKRYRAVIQWLAKVTIADGLGDRTDLPSDESDVAPVPLELSPTPMDDGV